MLFTEPKILPVVLVAAGLGVFAYLSGDVRFANYLHIPYVKYTSELVVICAAMIGAGLAFLWFNAHPAQVFMGDVGALSLGAMLGTIAVMVRQEIVFAIMAGVFLVHSECPINVYFLWRHCITIMRKKDGVKHKLLFASGLLQLC